jgi:hypothetical protein
MTAKPSDHPDFFRLAPPPGQSRESRLRLDAEGRFWHEGELVARPALAQALHRWIGRHPDDGRYVLNNGYDWCYLAVDDVPYRITALRVAGARLWATLDDGTEEPLDLATLHAGADGALRAEVKGGAAGGAFPAKLTRAAQAALLPLVEEGADGRPELALDGRRYPLPSP